MPCSAAQSWPTLWDPMNCSPSGSSVCGILQAKILKWVAIPFSRRSSGPRDWTHVEPRSPALHADSTVWATSPICEAILNIFVFCFTVYICLFIYSVCTGGISLVAQVVKNLPAMQETWVQSLDREDPLEKGMATHSSILAWRIPWTEEPGRLQSTGSQRVGHNWATNTCSFHATSWTSSHICTDCIWTILWPETRVVFLNQLSLGRRDVWALSKDSRIIRRRLLWRLLLLKEPSLAKNKSNFFKVIKKWESR